MQPATHRNKEIGMIELLKLCHKYGVDSNGIEQISKITRKHKTTITRAIYEYCIIPNLNPYLLDD